VAKAASDFGKPSGIVLVEPGHEAHFLDMLELKDVPGVGKATQDRLLKWNVRTVQEARQLPLELLQDAFGCEHGEAVFHLLRGEADPSGEAPDTHGPDQPKSISRETTFWTASNDYEFVQSMLFYLTERLGRALRRQGLGGRTAQLKLRYQDFVSVQCSSSLGRHTDRDAEVFAAASKLLRDRWCRSRRLRLVGVGLTDLRPARVSQRTLFDDGAERCRRLDRCLDQLRERFGFDAVRRGLSINLSRPGADLVPASELASHRAPAGA
jgi:DNA polymerase-4